MKTSLASRCTSIAILLVAVLGCLPDKAKLEQTEAIGEIELAMANGQYAVAKSKIDSLEALNSLSSRLLMLRGNCFSVEKNGPRAIAEFNLALKNCPKDSCKLRQTIFENRALEKRFAGKAMAEECLKDFLSAHRTALQCLPATKWDSMTNAFNAVGIAISLQHFELADSLANYLKRSFPLEVDGYETKAQFWKSQSKFDLAIREYDTIIDIINKDRPEKMLKFLFTDRADLYHQKGDLKAACADWQKALDLGLEDAQPKLDSFCRGK